MKSSKKEGTEDKSRKLSGTVGFFAKIPAACICLIGAFYLLDIPGYFNIAIYQEQYLSLFLTLILISTFFIFPGTKHAPRNKLPWYDVLLILLSLATGGYFAIFYPEMITLIGLITLSRVILCTIILVLVFEATRRVVGWPIVIVGLTFILFTSYAHFMPGMLHNRNIPWSRLLTYFCMSPNALFGIPLAIAGTIVFGFIAFGQILFAIGGGQFLTDTALALMGRFRGGAAKVSIMASCFFGMLSGSASANVAMTGIVTIPLMKRTGYRPEFAGAVEAVASTGGLIMPPIMAATAFIMADFLEIAYSKIAIAAAIPAILYFIAVFVQVDLEAAKHGLRGLPPDQLPSFKKVFKYGWFYIIPAAILIFCLFIIHLRPETSAMYAIGGAILVGLFNRKARSGLNKPFAILERVGRGLIEVGLICALAGIIIGAITLSGLGLSLSETLVKASGGNLLVLLALAAVGSIVLGMGMPATAAYIMLVILIGPALIELGVDPLAAHLFIFYFGCMSFLTPPVAIAAYVAASIAKSEPVRTAFVGVRLGVAAYIVPFVFALSPSLLLKGSIGAILLDSLTALLGVIFCAVALEGFLFAYLGILKRLCIGFGGLCLIVPYSAISVLGLILGASVLLVEWRTFVASNRQHLFGASEHNGSR